MTSPLLPSLTGRQLTVDYALKTPTLIRNQIAKLAAQQILLPKFFRTGAPVSGGGMLYSTITTGDFFLSDNVEKRAPGDEYATVRGLDPDVKLALVEDWGCKFRIPVEVITRNNVNYLDQQTIQAANTLTRKLDNRVVSALQAANIGAFAPANGWANLKFVGPLDAITPSASRPTAHFAQAQQLADLDELGTVFDLLVVHPEQATQLRTAYAEGLDDMLKSVGVEMFISPRIPAGIAYLAQKGQVGAVGFEYGLVTEVWDDYPTRSNWVQTFVVPAIAVTSPFRAKTITSLSGS
ncbi:MAG: hypothetical protein JWR37_406 [Mycobacterium sp.]|nr:hypothetical protein [Mycobacterium sp.]